MVPKKPNDQSLAIDRLLSEQADAIADLPPSKSAALAAYRERYAARPPAPKPTITKTDADQIAIEVQGDTPRLDWLILANALGASRTGFLFELVDQIAQVTTKNRTPDQQAFDFMIDAIAGLKPRDEVEAMLGAQMVATHRAVMRHLRMLNHCETVPQLEAQERAVTKLSRTYVAQMEALKKYRSRGEQKVEVRHVHVNDGGQAVIGSVETGGGHDQKK